MGNVLTKDGAYFHQTTSNLMKMGAYYTDPEHCEDIGKMFEFSTEDSTCCLEPSIGNGLAISLVTSAQSNEQIKIFGVELNDTVANETAANPLFTSILKGDFLNDVFITNRAFSFCFANPPYMDEMDLDNNNQGVKKERLEKKFLDKVANYMRPDGIVAWVIPHRVFIDDAYSSFWMSRFETLACYKFRPAEFAKWKQIVIIGKRRHGNIGILKDRRIAFQEAMALEKIAELPHEFHEKIKVPTSSIDDIKSFKTRIFDEAAAEQYCKEHPEELLGDFYNAVGKYVSVPNIEQETVLTPPIPLKKANIALLITCGVGSGYAGTDGVDLHLHRSTVETKEETIIDPDNRKEIVRSKANITMTIIEQDGTITDLV